MMTKKDYLYGIGLYGTQGLKEFLETRPKEEEMGESLDCFKKYLEATGSLTTEMEKDIRSQHLAYLSDLLDSEIPLLTASSPNCNEDYLIREFCEEAEEVLYTGTLDDDILTDFLAKYNASESPYISITIAQSLMRYRRYKDALPFITKSISKIFLCPNKYWDNKESMFACAMFLHTIYCMLGEEGIAKLEKETKHFRNIILEYTYLLLSRVVCWPEKDERTIFSYNVPITYSDRISALLKRANILLSNEKFFTGIIPSYSTPGSLAVSDYSMAHNFSYAEGVLGIKSQFKRDSKDLYASFKESQVRPYSTAITDGKKDSVELAHRFYLKYKRGEYYLNNNSIALLTNALKASFIYNLSTYNDKSDKTIIRDYLRDNGITCFYHFTEVENIANIKKYGGLFSQRQCLVNSIPIKTIGDMRHLREKDASFYLEDYVRLSFCKFHPLIKYREKEGANLVILLIKLDVAWFNDTLFSDMDAAMDEHHHGGNIDDLRMVDIDAISKTDLPANHVLYSKNQAEVMVRSMIPIDYIMNIEKPIYVKKMGGV